MRSRKVICDHYQGMTNPSSSSISIKQLQQNDDSFLKYSLLFDNNFWSARFDEVLNNARQGNKYLSFEIPSSSSSILDQTKVLSKILKNQKSLLRHLCHSMYKIFLLATQSIDNHILILDSGRKCLDTISRFVISTLPENLQYENETLLSIYNVIDSYMLTLNDNKMYQRLWNSACILAQSSDTPLIQHITSFLDTCREDIKSTTNTNIDDRILLDKGFLDTAVIEVNKIPQCKTPMDKLAQIIHVLQLLSTQRLVEKSPQQHGTMNLGPSVSSSSSSVTPSSVKLSQMPVEGESDNNAEIIRGDKDGGGKSSSRDNIDTIEIQDKGCSLSDDGDPEEVVEMSSKVVECSEDVTLRLVHTASEGSKKTNEITDVTEAVVGEGIDTKVESSSESVKYEQKEVVTSSSPSSSPSPPTTVALIALTPSKNSSMSLGDVFTNALQWLPPSYQIMIKTRLQQFHQLYVHGKDDCDIGKEKENAELGHMVPVGTELLILRLRYTVLEAIRRSSSILLSSISSSVLTETFTSISVVSSSCSCSNWNAEVVYLSALAPEGEWLLGPSGYAMATLSTALQLQSLS